jgi:hypothetical protein
MISHFESSLIESFLTTNLKFPDARNREIIDQAPHTPPVGTAQIYFTNRYNFLWLISKPPKPNPMTSFNPLPPVPTRLDGSHEFWVLGLRHIGNRHFVSSEFLGLGNYANFSLQFSRSSFPRRLGSASTCPFQRSTAHTYFRVSGPWTLCLGVKLREFLNSKTHEPPFRNSHGISIIEILNLHAA